MNIKEKIKALEQIQLQIDLVNSIKSLISGKSWDDLPGLTEESKSAVLSTFTAFCSAYSESIEASSAPPAIQPATSPKVAGAVQDPKDLTNKAVKQPSPPPDKIKGASSKFTPDVVYKLKGKRIEVLVQGSPTEALVEGILGTNLKVKTQYNEIFIIRPNQISKVL